MAFLDRFKSGKHLPEKKAPKAKADAKPAASKKADDKPAEKGAPVKAAPPKDTTAYRALIRPIVSEKTSRLEKNRQFTFVVAAGANKVEIKKAVEKHYRVHVTGVNVVNTGGKWVRSRQGFGRRSDWRKAYVTIREGENITF